MRCHVLRSLCGPRQRPYPERVLKKLSALAQPLPGRPRISTAVTEGEAISEILRHARLLKADLIAVGMHRATNLSRESTTLTLWKLGRPQTSSIERL